MKHRFPLPCLAMAALALAAAARADQSVGDAAQAASSYPLSTYSALGSSFVLHGRLSDLGWTDAQISAFVDGVIAGLHGKAFPFDDTARQASDDIVRKVEQIESRERRRTFSQPTDLKRYLDDACKRMGLEQSDSGLCYAIRFGATGMRPGPEDTVIVAFQALAADGTTELPQLSNPCARGRVADMLPGIAEGLQMLTVGSQAVFLLPPSLSFRDGRWPPGVNQGSPIFFRTTLVRVLGKPPNAR